MSNSGFLNKKQLVKAYNDGQLDEVLTQIRRYGNIVSVVDWESNESCGQQNVGCWRKYKITHHGLQWEARMLNGELKSIGYKF